MTTQKIKTDIENHFRVRDIAIQTRERPYPQLKGLYYLLASELCTATTADIAKQMNHTHSMAIYWREKMKYDMKYYPEIEMFYNNYAQSVWHVWEKDAIYV